MLGHVAVGDVTLLSWDFFGRYLDNQVTRYNVVENFRDQVTC